MDGVMLPGNATNTEPPNAVLAKARGTGCLSPPIHQQPAAYTDTAAARRKSGMLQAMLTIGNAVVVGSRRPSGRLNLPVASLPGTPLDDQSLSGCPRALMGPQRSVGSMPL